MIALIELSNRFIVLTPERYTYNGMEIIVPRGFDSDLASIPRVFWGIFPPHHYRYRLAALVHDYLIKDQGYIRENADLVFKEIMQVSGNPKWKTWLMYNAVRTWSKIKQWDN